MRLTRTQRLILLATAVVSCAVVLVVAFALRAPVRVQGVDAAAPKVTPKATDPTAPKAGTLDDPAGQRELTTATTSTTPTTVSAAPGAPPSTTVPRTATTTPRTTPTAPPAPPVTTTTAPPTGVAPEAACNAKLAELRAQGWDQGSQVACVANIGGTYTANVSNGTMGRQIIAYADGSVSVS